MSTNTAQSLPPKMAAQFAERARKGEALLIVGGTHMFVQGNQIITVFNVKSPNGPTGTVEKAYPGEIAALKKQAEEAKKLNQKPVVAE